MNRAQEQTARQAAPVAPMVMGLRLPPTFRALRHRNYRLYWFGQLISLIGTWMQNVAQPWLVYRLTGSPLALGLVSFSQSVPILMLALWGGVIADRVDKRKLIIITQTIAMTLAFVLAALTWSGAVQVWHVMLIAFCLGCSDAFDMPARQVFVAETVGKEDLMNAIALNSTMFNTARIIGPAVAGVLVAALGEAGAFTLNGLSYIAVIAMLFMIKMAPPEASAARGGSLARNLKEGLNYVRHDKKVLTLLAMVAVPAIFGMPYSTLMPIFARDVLQVGASGQGLLLAATGLGALIGALTLASLGNFPHKGRLVTGGAIVFSIGLILFSFSRSFYLSLLILPFVGAAMITQMSSTQTLLQTTVPDALRGRVMSVYMLMFRGMQPFAGLQGGTMATVFASLYGASNGAPLAVGLGGTICLLFALGVMARAPAVRRLE
ncbi:MAG: MFS transporter [Chloroflexi bacterium]|nr:MFS transporter [Chloroflexota bacterium]